MDAKVELPAKVAQSVPASVRRATGQILWVGMIRETATERAPLWRGKIHVLEPTLSVHYAAFLYAQLVVEMVAHTDEVARFLKERPHELADHCATGGRHPGLVSA